MLTFNPFADCAALCHAVATRWVDLIIKTPADHPCSFALAGGTTPAPLYRHVDALLSAAKTRPIQLIATDERWVPDTDPQSNEGLFQRCLTASFAQWNLISLKNNQSFPEQAVPQIDARIKQAFPDPFTAVILGMGNDGHIASLFPDRPKLLTTDSVLACVATRHPQTGQARMSLSFARLLNAQAIWLVLCGAEKRAVLERAEKTHLGPIGALLARAHVDVFYT
jgi:6-phosphogluconolactonase